MATFMQYSLDACVKYRLELTQEGNALRVRGDLTPDNESFLLESGFGLLDTELSVVILDMRQASPSHPTFAEKVARVADHARAHGKALAVLASGRALEWMRQMGVKFLFDRPAPAPAVGWTPTPRLTRLPADAFRSR